MRFRFIGLNQLQHTAGKSSLKSAEQELESWCKCNDNIHSSVSHINYHTNLVYPVLYCTLMYCTVLYCTVLYSHINYPANSFGVMTDPGWSITSQEIASPILHRLTSLRPVRRSDGKLVTGWMTPWWDTAAGVRRWVDSCHSISWILNPANNDALLREQIHCNFIAYFLCLRLPTQINQTNSNIFMLYNIWN